MIVNKMKPIFHLHQPGKKYYHRGYPSVEETSKLNLTFVGRHFLSY